MQPHRKQIRVKRNKQLMWRTRLVIINIYLAFGLLLARLFYWQVVKAADLSSEADAQYQRQVKISGQRGRIYFHDGKLLVGNKVSYRLFAHPHLIKEDKKELATILAQKILPDWDDYQSATGSARQELSDSLREQIFQKINKDVKWVSLATNLSAKTKESLETLDKDYLGFDKYYVRDYPEASIAAHLTGFVGKDAAGNDIGYFGLEGALEQELKPKSKLTTVIADALGLELFSNSNDESLGGRDVITTLRRDIQFTAEEELKKGMKKYGAEKGEVIILEPQTGNLLALAALPNYDPENFQKFDSSIYKNPSLSDLYEPGSTFKVITVAAGIDSGEIEPDSICTNCAGPRKIGKYTIRTWNDQYHPNSTIKDGLARSDNVAMIFVAEKVGSQRFQQYLKKFGIGEKIHIDLQEDQATPFPNKWGPVELATISFGQGISLNSLQLVRAVSAIANQGVMMRPNIISEVRDPISHEIISVKNQVEGRVVSPQTAQKVTKMMIYAASKGEAKWTASKIHTIAGKTGTSQIAGKGGYEANATIASFVGFAPTNNPKFVMLVKLTKPTSSPWAAETAAPLWYKIAKKLYLLMEIPPDKTQPENQL